MVTLSSLLAQLRVPRSAVMLSSSLRSYVGNLADGPFPASAVSGQGGVSVGHPLGSAP
jgi:hypothetical protein